MIMILALGFEPTIVIDSKEGCIGKFKKQENEKIWKKKLLLLFSSEKSSQALIKKPREK